MKRTATDRKARWTKMILPNGLIFLVLLGSFVPVRTEIDQIEMGSGSARRTQSWFGMESSIRRQRLTKLYHWIEANDREQPVWQEVRRTRRSLFGTVLARTTQSSPDVAFLSYEALDRLADRWEDDDIERFVVVMLRGNEIDRRATLNEAASVAFGRTEDVAGDPAGDSGAGSAWDAGAETADASGETDTPAAGGGDARSSNGDDP